MRRSLAGFERRLTLYGYEQRSARGYSLPGYSSGALIGGIQLPGWCVAVAAFATAILVSSGNILPLVLCMYGGLHAGFMFVAVRTVPDMNPSIGIVVVLLGFVTQLVAVFTAWLEKAR